MQEERTVEVLQVPEEVDEELLYLYFENKRRSGGGPLVSVEILDGCATLVFEDAEAAERVLSKGHHVLHNAELIVRKPATKDQCRLLLRGINPSTSTEMIELYVENMTGLNQNDYSLHPSAGRDLILIHLTQPFSQDLQNLSAKISKRTLDGAKITVEQIEQTDTILVENVHPGISPDQLSLYFEKWLKVKDVIMLSEHTAKMSFVDRALGSILENHHKLEGVDLVVKPYFGFLQPVESVTSPVSENERQNVTQGTSEDVRNHIPIQTSPLLVDMAADTLSSLPTTSDPTSEVAAEVVMEEAVVVSSHIAFAEPAHLALFQISPILQDIEKTHPTFTTEIKDGGVHVAGPDEHTLENIKLAITECIANMAVVHLPLEPEKAQFLAREDVKKRLLQTLTQSNSPSIYSVSDSVVVVSSLTRSSADKACDFLQSQICHFSIPIDRDSECMLYCREWSGFEQALAFSSVKVSEPGRNIDVLTLTEMETETQMEIVQFLSTPIEREIVIPMKPGELKYIQNHCHQLLADMDQLSIFPLEDEETCGFKILGPAVACQMAEEVIQGVVSSILNKTLLFTAPGLTRYFEDKECKSMLKEMETKFQVYIDIKCTPWKHLDYQDYFENGWKIMAQKNFQRVSVNGAAQELQEESMQTDHGGGSDQGPSEEEGGAESVNQEQLEASGTSLPQSVVMDNEDPSTAGRPNLTDNPTPLSAEGNNVNDVIPNLSKNPEDEDAQLSLAIQYSMESNQQSLEHEEEEQLKKALELSRKSIPQETASSGTDKKPEVQKRRKNILNSFREEMQTASIVHLDVYAVYESDLNRVAIAFGKRISQRQVEEKIENKCLRRITEHHRMCLEGIMRKHAVEIEIKGTVIIVSGFKIFVTGGLWDVKLLLERMEKSVSKQEILKTVQWMSHDPAAPEPIPYPPDLNILIEYAWELRRQSVDVLLDNQACTITFDKMQELNTDAGKHVKVLRRRLDVGDLEHIPEEEYTLLTNVPETIKLDKDCDEFQQVVKSFYSSLHEHHCRIRIIQVEKLMNRLLYNQYKLKKASVLKRATYPEVERTLYHGTCEDSVKEICVQGFNRSFCGKNATVYGQGVYFAVSSSLSVQDQYSPPNADGYKFILVSKVLTGDFTKGCHSMKTAPLMDESPDDVPLRYDSVTDDIAHPTMFVIFNDTQAFPEYLITCQRIFR